MMAIKCKYHNRPLESFREELHSQGQARVSDHFDAEAFVFACPYTEPDTIKEVHGWDADFSASQYDDGPINLIMRKGEDYAVYQLDRGTDVDLCRDVEHKVYPARAIIVKEGGTAYIRED